MYIGLCPKCNLNIPIKYHYDSQQYECIHCYHKFKSNLRYDKITDIQHGDYYKKYINIVYDDQLHSDVTMDELQEKYGGKVKYIQRFNADVKNNKYFIFLYK